MYLFSRIGHFKKNYIERRGFRGGSDEKMRRMWFGPEIDVVGLPPLIDLSIYLSISTILIVCYLHKKLLNLYLIKIWKILKKNKILAKDKIVGQQTEEIK